MLSSLYTILVFDTYCYSHNITHLQLILSEGCLYFVRYKKKRYVMLKCLLSLFQEKQILQRAHGQQELAELALTPSNGTNQEAKRCVDMWLKMPGRF